MNAAEVRRLAEQRRRRGQTVARFAVQRRRQAPDLRARALLVAHLTAEQTAAYEAHGYFDVTAASGRRYRIHRGRVHNIWLLPEAPTSWWRRFGPAVSTTSYCLQPTVHLPVDDGMLAQLLLLRADERRFLQLAASCRPGIGSGLRCPDGGRDAGSDSGP